MELILFSQQEHENLEFEKELHYLNEALKNSNNDNERLVLLEKLGSCSYLLERNEAAKDFFYKALDLIREKNNNKCDYTLGIIYDRLGSILYYERKFEKALEFKLKALNYTDKEYSNDIHLINTFIGIIYGALENK